MSRKIGELREEKSKERSRWKVTKTLKEGWNYVGQLAECVARLHEAMGAVPIIDDAYVIPGLHSELSRLAWAI